MATPSVQDAPVTPVSRIHRKSGRTPHRRLRRMLALNDDDNNNTSSSSNSGNKTPDHTPLPRVLCTACQGTTVLKGTTLDDVCSDCFRDALADFAAGWETVAAFYGPHTLSESAHGMRVVVRRSRSFLQRKFGEDVNAVPGPLAAFEIHYRQHRDMVASPRRYRRYMNATPWEDGSPGYQ